MAEYTDSYFIEIGTISIDYSGTQVVSTGWVDIDLSSLPENEYFYFQFVFDNYNSTGNYNASISFIVDGNTVTHQISGENMEIELGGIATKYKIDVSGNDDESSGTLLLEWASERLYFKADTESIPIVEILSVSKYKLSSHEDFNTCIVGLTSNLELQYWELRATLPDDETGHGVGLLVESYDHLYAGETKYAYIEYNELSNGDNVYTINAYGQSVNGVWSDG